ncbi:MAG: hypothetical protein JWM73_1277, partial [Solirubrobacterales bacterium]|nr:hypothetical protein [Solirubrobacterales bacterium]
MLRRGVLGMLVAFGLMTGSAHAFQAGVMVMPGKSGIVQAR